MSPTYTALKFTMHEKIGEYYVQIIDEETKEVIREVPPKKNARFICGNGGTNRFNNK